MIFPCSTDHEQDWQPYPIDPYSCYMCSHTYTLHRLLRVGTSSIYIHIYIYIQFFFLADQAPTIEGKYVVRKNEKTKGYQRAASVCTLKVIFPQLQHSTSVVHGHKKKLKTEHSS